MRFLQRNRGWIGIDVGTSAVKIAQVTRSKHGWSLASSAIVPRQQGWQPDQTAMIKAESSLDELQAAKSLQQGCRGRKVAATLPMSLCDVHRFDRDLTRDPNTQKILRQAIETATQQSVEHLQCDYWSTPAMDEKPACSQALTVSRGWTDQLCEDISQVGWSCQAIDGLPLAMTRAVSMVHPDTATTPVAALDWGSGRATLCFIENGQPTYVRCLKDCGLHNMINALVEELQVNAIEAQRLLEEFGMATASSKETADITTLVQRIISEPLRRAVDEIKRSISHFQFVRRSPSPQHLYLIGGGAMINDLDSHLTNELELQVKNWQLPTQGMSSISSDPRAECLLASAIALSAMAWEAS